MTEIIRAPKVSKRSRMLPFARIEQEATAAARAAKRNSQAKANGSPTKRSADDEQVESARDVVHREALDKANSRAEAAEQRLAQLEREIEQHIAENRERGFAEGYRDGGEQGRNEIEKAIRARLQSVDSLCDEIRSEFSSYLHDAVQDTVTEVVLAAAGKFMGDAVVDRDSVVAIVDQATRNVESGHSIRIRVAPSDFEFLNDREWAPSRRNGGSQLEFVPDERIKLGGCVVETSHGELDARLETQLRRLKEVLLDTRARQLAGENG